MKYYRKVLTEMISSECLIPGIPRIFNGVEVGVAAGKTSTHLLRVFPTLHLTCVDRWLPPWPVSAYAQTRDMFANGTDEEHEKRYEQAVHTMLEYRTRVTLLRASSENVANAVPDGWYDFIFIDGDHSYDGVMEDLENWWPKVRPGGLFCGHDFDNRVDENGLDSRGRGVAKAVKEFFLKQQTHFFIAEGGIWWLTKLAKTISHSS